MTKTGFAILSALLFSSCSSKLITKGLPLNSPDFVVTTEGKKIESPSVSIQQGSVKVGDTVFLNKSLSGVKKGQAYYGVKDGSYYNGVLYGKINLLTRVDGYSFSTNSAGGSSSHAISSFYIQKNGRPEIAYLASRALKDYVRDNPLALRKARAADIFGTVNLTTLFTSIAGILCVFIPETEKNYKVREIAIRTGLYSLPVYIVTLPIAPRKRLNAVKVYNRN